VKSLDVRLAQLETAIMARGVAGFVAGSATQCEVSMRAECLHRAGHDVVYVAHIRREQRSARRICRRGLMGVIRGIARPTTF
jgi:hypothetical protein